MGASADQRERVIRQVRAFLRRAGLDEAILFGSRARSDWLTTSDVDLIVVSPRFEGVRLLDRMYRLHDCWDGPEELEALPYSPEEFARAREDSGLVRAALTHGLVVRAHDADRETPRGADTDRSAT